MMNNRVTLGACRGIVRPVYVDGRPVGLIVLNPSGYQFKPEPVGRVYMNPDDLMCIADHMKKITPLFAGCINANS